MSNRSAFVLCSAMGHSLIVNRYDYMPNQPRSGVSIELLEQGEHDPGIALLVARLAMDRKVQRGHVQGGGVIILDVGANIGNLTVFWARLMVGASDSPWGRVIAFEPQEWPFYALCGNIALNNCFNAQAHRMALGNRGGVIAVPFHHPLTPHNFGGVSLNTKSAQSDDIPIATIDELGLARVDIIKIDVEGMEPDVLAGAAETIKKHRPIIVAETICCGAKAIRDAVEPLGYVLVMEHAANTLCVHKDENNASLQAAIAALKAGK